MKNRPNVVLILADDLGYGDVACLNPRGRISTPNLDRLAAEGMVFTDAHSTSSICTPSRYGLLTGRYNWRTRLQSGIVAPYGAPLIARGRLTLGGLFQGCGYHTACVGKWHLGWEWPFEVTESFLPARGGPVPGEPTAAAREAWRRGFSRPIEEGPTTRGFHSYFGVDVPNWPPYVFVENDRTVGIPSQYLSEEDYVPNVRASLRGPAVADWSLEAILPMLGDAVCATIREQAAAETPFFVYMPLTSPHTPLAVNESWRGRSGLNLYADFVMETDAVVGRVLAALEEAGVAEETLVVFTSDNGCAPQSGVGELESMGHFPSAQYRGYKCDIWDGGHRMPFLVRWPGVVAPGGASDRTACLTDLMATCADILGVALPPDAGEDSVSLLPLLRGEDVRVRDHVISHSGPGKFAIRSGDWKLVLCGGSGGWGSPTDKEADERGLPPIQLYHLGEDPGETDNRQAACPDKVAELLGLLERVVAEGRSTPGPKQANDAPVDIRKTLS